MYKGVTPLHVAAMVNASEAAGILLKAGADANTKTNKGATPLDVAAMKNASETAEVLGRYGAR